MPDHPEIQQNRFEIQSGYFPIFTIDTTKNNNHEKLLAPIVFIRIFIFTLLTG